MAAARLLSGTLFAGVLVFAGFADAASGSPRSIVGMERVELVPHSGSSEGRLVVGATQEIVMLLKTHRVFPTLRADAVAVTSIGASRPVTGSPTVLPVTGRAIGPDGAEWLRVLIPGRPNGRTGWIARRGTELTSTPWHIVVTTTTRRVLVYRRGILAQRFSAIVGKSSTPTPHGKFFVEESVLMPRGSAGAPFALALSARSNLLARFEGGRGQIALHGMENLGGTLGTATSHGCVRLSSRGIRWLAEHIAPGTPVTITG
jgi:hypothetical protein